MLHDEVVETKRLRLEPWGAEAHTQALAELNADPEVMRFLGGPVTHERSVEISQWIARHWQEYGFGLWAVVERATGRVAGYNGICHPRWHPQYADQVEVGWRFARWAWGHGYATEAATRGLEWGWALALEEIIAFVDPANDRSLAVTRRLGMSQCGEATHPDDDDPMLVLSIRRP